MSCLTVGTRVWLSLAYTRGEPMPTTIAAVGRTWITLEGGQRRFRPAPQHGYYSLDCDRGSGRAYTDAQLVAREHASITYDARRAAIRALESATPETILTICRILGIDTPDALPTEGEVLARFGALPLTSDRSIE